MKHDGLPPLDSILSTSGTIIFENVRTVFLEKNGRVVEVFHARDAGALGRVVVKGGNIQ